MSASPADDFLALGEEKIAAFLKENKAPAQFDAKTVVGLVRGGQITPKAMAERMKAMGGGAAGGGTKGEKGKGAEREKEVLAWLDANEPEAILPWTPVTLPDGTKAEVGGLDPFAEVAPPAKLLEPAVAAHTETILDLAGKLPDLAILSLDARPLGAGVYRVRAVAGNRGELPTHTKMAERARAHLPVRLAIEKDSHVRLLTGLPFVTSERLEGKTGTLAGEWLIEADPGTTVRVTVTSDQAGSAEKSLKLEKGDAR